MVKAVYKNNGCGRKINNIFKDNPYNPLVKRQSPWSGNYTIERESRLDHNTQYSNSTSGQKGSCSLSTDAVLSPVFQGLTTNISWFLQKSVPFPDLWLASADPWKH